MSNNKGPLDSNIMISRLSGNKDNRLSHNKDLQNVTQLGSVKCQSIMFIQNRICRTNNTKIACLLKALIHLTSYTWLCASHLCRTMACFHLIAISVISSGDHPCAHYVLWMLPLCALLLCSMTHYDITMVHNVVMDAPL